MKSWPVTSSSVLVQTRLMLCTRCHTFVGDPCGCCRTISRLRFIVETGKLRVNDEGEALTALRSCAGVLTDLAETATRFRPPVLPVPFLPVPPGQSGALSTEAAAPGTEEERSEARQPEHKEETKVPESSGVPEKKEKRKKEKKRDKERKEAEVGREPARGSRDLSGELIEVKEEPEDDAEASEDKREPLPRRSRGREDPGVETERTEGEATEVTEEDWDRYNLGDRPVRGSAARHFRAREEGSWADKPPEPPAPPPRRRNDSERPRKGRGKGKRSRTPRRRGTKGKQHRERGRWWGR